MPEVPRDIKTTPGQTADWNDAPTMDGPPRCDDHAGPTAFGPYELQDILGEGAMGKVHRAVHRGTKETVAVKFIVATAADADKRLELFTREANVLRQLVHKRIVRFIELGFQRSRFFLVMEYVPTVDLLPLLAGMDVPQRIRLSCGLICQVLEGLDYAHRLSFIHRDIKPSNILVAKRDKKFSTKIADFGLAKSFASSGLSGLTGDGEARGTLHYIPPEQLLSARDVTPAADIFATAATLYRFIAGSVPHDYSTGKPTFIVAMEDPTVPIVRRLPEIPKPLADAIDRSLSRNPADRHPSAAAFRKALLPFATAGFQGAIAAGFTGA